MFKLQNLPLTISLIVLISLIVGWGISMILAWTEPPGSPPSPNVDAPINIGGDSQSKTGIVGFSTSGVDTDYGLTVGINATKGIKSDRDSWFGGNISIGGDITAVDEICLDNGCQRDWPTGVDGCTNCLNATEISDIYVLNTSDTMSGSLTVNKLYVTTIDPIYEIDGKKYATYVADFAGGVRTETSGVIQLNSETEYVIDFDNLEKGTDLWLFWETSNKEMDDLAVVISAGFEGKVWYDKQGHKLTIYGDEPGEVSYRLTLPRLDDEEWGNMVE